MQMRWVRGAAAAAAAVAAAVAERRTLTCSSGAGTRRARRLCSCGFCANARGFQMTREIVDGEAGWIIGRRERSASPAAAGGNNAVANNNAEAFYAVRDRSFLPPPRKWGKTWQYLGQSPAPSVALHELDAVALGYDESEIEAAAEQARIELKMEESEAQRRRGVIDKVKRAAARAKEDREQLKRQALEAKKKKMTLQIETVEGKEGDGSEFFPVSPDRRRALARRPPTQALAWQTPEQGKSLKARKSLARKMLDEANRAPRFEKEDDPERGVSAAQKSPRRPPSPPLSPAIQEHIDHERANRKAATESFTAKREERYQYYQNRLRANQKQENTRAPKAAVARIALANLSNKSTTSGGGVVRKASTTQMI